MIAQPMPAPAFLIPESAPFTAEQRAWLSGVFAATLLTDVQGASALGNAEAAALGAPAAGPALADNDDAPWHDPSRKIEDRMQLAKERPATTAPITPMRSSRRRRRGSISARPAARKPRAC